MTLKTLTLQVVLVIWLLFCVFSGPSLAAETPPVNPTSFTTSFSEILPGEDKDNLAPFVRFLKLEGTNRTPDIFDNMSISGETLAGNAIHFGPPGGTIYATFSLKNASASTGSWILTTGRGSVRFLEIYDLSGGDKTLLFSTLDRKSKVKNLRSYQAFSQEIRLAPHEFKTFGFIFEEENSTFLPLQVQTYTSFFKDRRANITLVSSVIAGVLILIFLNIFFFFITGQREFIWLGLAEFAFALNTLHAEGYTTIFLFANMPLVSLAIGDIFKCAFAAAMAQFARSFIKTRKNFPLTDKVLIVMIAAAVIVSLLQIGVGVYSTGFKITLHSASWIIAVLIAMYLPYVGIIATTRLGRQYWPLILAWSSLGLYVFYAAIASTGLIAGLPINWHLAGPIGLFEAVMATFALGLHLKVIQQERLTAQNELKASLLERIEISERAARMTSERQQAVATVRDQNALIHASGHDSRNVLMALRNIISAAKMSGNTHLTQPTAQVLEASANYLEDIISTTTSARASFGASGCTAYSSFETEAFARQMEMIYKPLAQSSDLQFYLECDEVNLISDRAILSRAVSNLLSNSLYFTKRGKVSLSIKSGHDALIIQISDTGTGISASDLDMLLKEDIKNIAAREDGSGTGIAATRRIIAQLGGALHIKSALGNGTTVSISLPPCYSQSDTPLSEKDCKRFYPDVTFINADKDLLSEESYDGKLIVASDGSIETRERVGAISRFMLVRPIYKACLSHPIIMGHIKEYPNNSIGSTDETEGLMTRI